jgi:DNA-binding GntR family transcriptional regulator
MQKRGLGTSTLVLAAGIGPAPHHVDAALGVHPGDAAVYVRRLRLVEGEPSAIYQSYLPNRWAAVL